MTTPTTPPPHPVPIIELSAHDLEVLTDELVLRRDELIAADNDPGRVGDISTLINRLDELRRVWGF